MVPKLIKVKPQLRLKEKEVVTTEGTVKKFKGYIPTIIFYVREYIRYLNI